VIRLLNAEKMRAALMPSPLRGVRDERVQRGLNHLPEEKYTSAHLHNAHSN
jgi:hypothetical protein